jgi:hypothetical protein
MVTAALALLIALSLVERLFDVRTRAGRDTPKGCALNAIICDLGADIASPSSCWNPPAARKGRASQTLEVFRPFHGAALSSGQPNSDANAASGAT